jgi:hypothetical protein
MAVCGHNGNNETKIGLSNSVGISFYDENLNEIKIINSKSTINLTILRDVNLPEYLYQYVNATQIQLSSGSLFLHNGIKLKSKNASLHIELKPVNVTLSYLIVIKLGFTPVINEKTTEYSSFKIFCPSRVFKLLIKFVFST